MLVERGVDVVGDTATTVVQITVGGRARVVAGEVGNLESLVVVGVFVVVAVDVLALEVPGEPGHVAALTAVLGELVSVGLVLMAIVSLQILVMLVIRAGDVAIMVSLVVDLVVVVVTVEGTILVEDDIVVHVVVSSRAEVDGGRDVGVHSS